MRRRSTWTAVGAVLAVLLPGCSSSTAPVAVDRTPAHRKVLMIVEEDRTHRQLVDHPASPYLHGLLEHDGASTQLRTGYPVRCPSTAGYLLLTSGSDHGVCDGAGPTAHRLTGDNLFAQVALTGRQWRDYAESMATTCATADSADGLFQARKVAAAFYASERERCRQWAVPMGSVKSGLLHDALATGTLPAFSLVTPNACDDMHGAPVCLGDLTTAADAWLSDWLPTVVAGPDYKAGRLVVIITWAGGSDTDDHIPTVVLSPATHRISDPTPATLCSVLRTVQDLLALPPLGCAAAAGSLASAFRL